MKSVYAAILVLLFASSARAQGVVMVTRLTAGGQTSTQQVQMDRTHIRTDAHQGGESLVVVYDGPAKTVRMINATKKTYTEMNQAQMQQMGQQVNAAMAAMQAQMKNMPPEQRKMMEDMMKGRGGMPGMAGAAPPARPVYKSAGADKVGQWACTKYEGYRGAEKVADVCAVDPAGLGLTASDFEAAKQLAELLKSMMPAAAEQMSFNGTAEDQGFPGVAIRRVDFRNGKPDTTSELVELRREAIPPAAFAVPAGFRKEEMPGVR